MSVKLAIAVGLCALSLGALGCGSQESSTSTDSTAPTTTGGDAAGGDSCVPRQGEPVGLDDASTVGDGKATEIEFPALDAAAELRVTATHRVRSLKTPDGTIDAGGGGFAIVDFEFTNKGTAGVSPLSTLADRLLVESADGKFWKSVTPTQGCHGANAAAASLSGKSDVKVATKVVKPGAEVRTSLAYPIAKQSEGPFVWTASASPGSHAVVFDQH